MTCSACSSHVQRAVEKLEGAAEVQVNLLTNSMSVNYDEAILGTDKIIEAVEKAGYGASLADSLKTLLQIKTRLTVRLPVPAHFKTMPPNLKEIR